MQQFLDDIKIQYSEIDIESNQQLKNHLQCAQEYYEFLVWVMTGKNRLLQPWFWLHGKHGLNDVLHYIQVICNNPEFVELETYRFLTGSQSYQAANVHSDIQSNASTSTTGGTGIWHYTSTTTSKWYSRIRFFNQLGYTEQLKEIFSLKWLIHHPVLNILLILVPIGLMTVAILNVHITLPAILTCITLKYAFISLPMPFIIKAALVRFKPIFGINLDRQVFGEYEISPYELAAPAGKNRRPSALIKSRRKLHHLLGTDLPQFVGVHSHSEELPPLNDADNEEDDVYVDDLASMVT